MWKLVVSSKQSPPPFHFSLRVGLSVSLALSYRMIHSASHVRKCLDEMELEKGELWGEAECQEEAIFSLSLEVFSYPHYLLYSE